MPKNTINPKISFIFPVYNEEEILFGQFNEFRNFLKVHSFQSYEIIFVENGSHDKTWSILKKIEKSDSSVRALRIHGSSYGRAMKHGLLSCFGKKIYVLDLDNLSLDFISRSLKLLDKYSVVIGSKTLKGSEDLRPLKDRLRTKIFNRILANFFKYPGTDSHGIRAFKRTVALMNTIVYSTCEYELLDTEILINLHRKGIKIKEIPTKVCELRSSRYKNFRRAKLVILDLYRLVGKRLSSFPQQEMSNIKGVTADDFGLDPITNQAIIDQYLAGNITKISILANLVKETDLTFLKRNCKNDELAVHFNLLRGKSISPAKNILSLLDKDGKFFPLVKFLFKLLFVQINPIEIERELQAQYQRLYQSGLSPKYLDSEQHLHLFTPVWNSILAEAERKKLIIRSEKSTQNQLAVKIHRLLVLKSFLFLLTMIYGKKEPFPTYDTIIKHPGNNYD